MSFSCSAAARGEKKRREVIFLSVCYSSLLARRAHSGENVASPAKANPQKPDECPRAAALGINSQFIEIPLVLEAGSLLSAGTFFRLIILFCTTKALNPGALLLLGVFSFPPPFSLHDFDFMLLFDCVLFSFEILPKFCDFDGWFSELE